MVKKKKKKWRLLLMILPFLLYVILFNYVPLFGWSFAFFNYKPGISLLKNEFVGFKYFIMFLTDRVDMFRVMKNTIIFALLGYVVSPLPMFFAIILNEIRSLRYKKIVQTFTTVPNFISWVIIYSLAFMLLSSEGVLNSVLTSLGIQAPATVLGDNKAVYWFQMVLGQWKGLGWGAIIYLAAIAGIDQELYQAAAIDGANRFKSIWHITVPLLMPTFLVLLLLSIGNFVNVGFEQYFVFNNPVVANNIEVLDIYVYRKGLMGQDYSFATAIGIMKSVLGITLLFIGNAIAKKVRGTNLI